MKEIALLSTFNFNSNVLLVLSSNKKDGLCRSADDCRSSSIAVSPSENLTPREAPETMTPTSQSPSRRSKRPTGQEKMKGNGVLMSMCFPTPATRPGLLHRSVGNRSDLGRTDLAAVHRSRDRARRQRALVSGNGKAAVRVGSDGKPRARQ
uniref:Uncharacterized protein n=1 Tax=Anopheles coluzzii TaxID=1518534 RepID=A0A8W7PCH5_ANOCL